MFQGTVAEVGTHASLLALPGGRYARLVAAQQLGADFADDTAVAEEKH
jgi:ABC-type multidrug transport system fused ATPase/permease subunit